MGVNTDNSTQMVYMDKKTGKHFALVALGEDNSKTIIMEIKGLKECAITVGNGDTKEQNALTKNPQLPPNQNLHAHIVGRIPTTATSVGNLKKMREDDPLFGEV